jgi:hypothetical protein
MFHKGQKVTLDGEHLQVLDARYVPFSENVPNILPIGVVLESDMDEPDEDGTYKRFLIQGEQVARLEAR